MAKPTIFVSHSHHDNEWCRSFVAALQQTGYDVWYDEKGLSGGAQWVATIEREVEDRDIFAVILTPEARASEWVNAELQLALATHRRIIPLVLKVTEIRGFLRTYQTVEVVDLSADSAAAKFDSSVSLSTGGLSPLLVHTEATEEIEGILAEEAADAEVESAEEVAAVDLDMAEEPEIEIMAPADSLTEPLIRPQAEQEVTTAVAVELAPPETAAQPLRPWICVIERPGDPKRHRYVHGRIFRLKHVIDIVFDSQGFEIAPYDSVSWGDRPLPHGARITLDESGSGDIYFQPSESVLSRFRYTFLVNDKVVSGMSSRIPLRDGDIITVRERSLVGAQTILTNLKLEYIARE